CDVAADDRARRVDVTAAAEEAAADVQRAVVEREIRDDAVDALILESAAGELPRRAGPVCEPTGRSKLIAERAAGVELVRGVACEGVHGGPGKVERAPGRAVVGGGARRADAADLLEVATDEQVVAVLDELEGEAVDRAARRRRPRGAVPHREALDRCIGRVDL